MDSIHSAPTVRDEYADYRVGHRVGSTGGVVADRSIADVASVGTHKGVKMEHLFLGGLSLETLDRWALANLDDPPQECFPGYRELKSMLEEKEKLEADLKAEREKDAGAWNAALDSITESLELLSQRSRHMPMYDIRRCLSIHRK